MSVIIIMKSVRGKKPYSEEDSDCVFDNVVGTKEDCIKYLMAKMINLSYRDRVTFYNYCLEIDTPYENEVYYFHEKELNDFYDRNIKLIGEEVIKELFLQIKDKKLNTIVDIEGGNLRYV